MTNSIKISDSKHLKVVQSKFYNYIFNKNNGFFVRWGKSKGDDPDLAPFPEILDIEVTTICNNGCPFCYKSNTKNGKNMSLNTFKTILDKMEINGQPFLTQIAFGADASCTSNPDLFDMMKYSRTKGVIPNITVANISDKIADKLVKLCGAVAVSRYKNKNICYDSVKRLTDRGLKQTNIHVMLSNETFDQVMETLSDRLIDSRLEKLNAIVILSLKQKGRGINHRPVSQERFNELVKFSLDNNISIGFDSCSQPKFMKSIEGHKDYKKFEMLAEPCESALFSSYINVDGQFSSCSFCDGESAFPNSIDVLSVDDFINDVWFGEPTKKWRETLLKRRKCGNFTCPAFNV